MTDQNSSFSEITGVSPEQGSTVFTIGLTLSSLSLSVTTLGCLMFLYIRLQYPQLADRVTFRLAFATMASDFLYSIFQIILNLQTQPTPACTGLMWGFVFLSLTSIFFPTCIAINLQATFINDSELRSRHSLEKYYIACSLALALVLSLLPFAENMYGWDAPEGLCFFRDSGEKFNIIWQWTVLYGWEGLCVLYIIIILILVVGKLFNVSNQLVSIHSGSDVSGRTVTSRYEKNILRERAIISAVVRKIIWYPVVPIITQLPNFLVETDIYVNRRVNFVMLLLTFLNSSQGLLNLLVFLQDIAVVRAYRLTKLRWWRNCVNAYEASYPHLSCNKSFNTSINSAQYYRANEIKTEDQNQGQEQVQNRQPSFIEKLQYNLLIYLFKSPRDSDVLLDYNQYAFLECSNEEEVSQSIQSINDKNGDGGETMDIGKDDEEEFNKNVVSKL